MPVPPLTAESVVRPPSVPPVPPIGVVIPTFNRSDVLLRCFEHLERQSWQDFEVIVVDDGSTDETPRLLSEYAARNHLRMRHIRQRNSGPAGARNHAISLVTAPICLMLGDDILASPNLVEEHLSFHNSHPDRFAFALGYTRWAREGQSVTPFMRWLEEDTPLQFAYADLLMRREPTWEHFYTSNLSGKTELLRSNPFREGFTHYGMEDIELGYRLSRNGNLQMHFLREAMCEHVHPTDIDRSCRRMMIAGFATYEFFRAWPECEPAEGLVTWKSRLRRRILERGFGLGLLRTTASVVTRFRCPNFMMEPALRLHHEAGMRQAQRRQEKSDLLETRPERPSTNKS